MTLDQEVEAIARRVAELLRADSAPSAQNVDASTIARRFGVTRAWVYQHNPGEPGTCAQADPNLVSPTIATHPTIWSAPGFVDT